MAATIWAIWSCSGTSEPGKRAGPHFGYPFVTVMACRIRSSPVGWCYGMIVGGRIEGHVAALGVHFYRGATLPADDRNDALVAQQARGICTDPIGYRIMRVRFDAKGWPSATRRSSTAGWTTMRTLGLAWSRSPSCPTAGRWSRRLRGTDLSDHLPPNNRGGRDRRRRALRGAAGTSPKVDPRDLGTLIGRPSPSSKNGPTSSTDSRYSAAGGETLASFFASACASQATVKMARALIVPGVGRYDSAPLLLPPGILGAVGVVDRAPAGGELGGVTGARSLSSASAPMRHSFPEVMDAPS